MQQGMLVNSLREPQKGVDISQVIVDLCEKIDGSSLLWAWEQVSERHESLRCAYQWDDVKVPAQIVYQCAKMPAKTIDLRPFSLTVQEEKYQQFLEQDRQLGFDFTQPPLMRLTLVQLEDEHFRMVWTKHHSISDGRSTTIVLRELFDFYDTKIAGKTCILPPPISYQLFAEWMEEQDWESHREYWQPQLKDISAPTTLPTPDTTCLQGDAMPGKLQTRLSQAVTNKLVALTQKHEFTLNTIIQGAWGLLLHHYTGEEHLIFGTIRACRYSAFAGSEKMVGQMINAVPIVASIPLQTPLNHWLESLRANWVAMRDHEHTPLAKQLEWSNIPNNSPLFESMVLLEGARLIHKLRQHSASWQHREIDFFWRLNFPLAVYCWVDNPLLLSVTYDQSRFSKAYVEGILNHLAHLLTMMAEHPNQPLSFFHLLDESTKAKIIDINQTGTPLPNETRIHKRIEDIAHRYPNQIAISVGGKQLSYAKLNRQANQLAHHLLAVGIKVGDRVATSFGRIVDLPITILAILKVGGIYVPIDPNYPSERQLFMLEDCQPMAVLIEEGRVLPDVGVPAFSLSSLPPYPDTNLNLDQPADLPAYIIYTSGSTGKPKGVICRHQAVTNMLYHFHAKFPIQVGEKSSYWTSSSFDVSIYEVLFPLLFGAELQIVPEPIRNDGELLFQWLADNQTQCAYLPPFMLAEFADWLTDNAYKIQLKYLLIGVEAISSQTCTKIAYHLPQLHIENGYGPTEATMAVATFTFQASNVDSVNLPIGRPTQNNQIYLLDAQLRSVPIGVIGELYIGGIQLADGYFNRPDLTRERFLLHPFRAGERLYRTGDFARYSPDGNIEFIGRRDNQVKLRGYRIELGEIETALMMNEAIQQAVVVVEPAGNRLVAYIVPTKKPIPSHHIQQKLSNSLPAHMMPAHFVWLGKIPTTVNGKTDRNALPKIQLQDEVFAPPQDTIEQLVADLYTNVLNVEKVGRNADFFELGGHSLLAMQIVSRLRKALDVHITVPALFHTPTVAGIAQTIQQLLLQADHPPSQLQTADHNQPLPLSFAQNRLWFLNQLDPYNTIYNMPISYQIEGELNIPVLEQVVNTLLRRHQSLRTIILNGDNAPIQQILPFAPISLTPQPIAEAELIGVLQTEACHIFELDKPLFRLNLWQISLTRHILCFHTHHIIADGWSHALWYNELHTLYTAFSENQSNPLPPIPYQYKDFAKTQRDWLTEEKEEQLLAYWSEQFAGVPTTSTFLPDYPRPAQQTYNGKRHAIIINPTLTANLYQLCQSEQVTLFIFLLTTLKALLYRQTRQDDLVIGIPVANRTMPETESIFGFFVDTLALRTGIQPHQTFLQLLAEVRHATLSAYSHQALPFDLTIEKLELPRTLAHTPLFQIFFNMVSLPYRATTSNLTITQLPPAKTFSKFDITLYVTEQNNKVQVEWVYNCDLYQPERIKMLGEQFIFLLEQIVSQPQQKLDWYSLCSSTISPLLPDPTLALSASSTIKPITTQFLQAVAQHPQKIAIQSESEQWDYATIKKKAFATCEWLRTEGVSDGDVVAIFAERHASLVWGILGVWFANAQFVILDPAYPESYLAEIVAQVKPKYFLRCINISAQPNLVRNHSESTLDFSTYEGDEIEEANAGDQPAYIAFTSGTTGRPKGIQGTHAPIAHFITWQQKIFSLTSADNFSLLAGLAHDPLIRDIFTPLTVGATLHIPDLQTTLQPDRLTDWFYKNEISVTHLTPALCRFMMMTPNKRELPTLHHAFFGGEQLTQDVIQPFVQSATHVQCVNFYGTTETPQAMTYHLIDPHQQLADVPVGKGIDSVQALVLNDAGKLAGVNELGIVHIRTPYLAKGYWQDNELTKKRFQPNPFRQDKDDRIYATGDWGYYRQDGAVVLVGRQDDGLNIHGFRLNPSMVNQVLGQHSAVSSAFTTVQHHPTTNAPQLIAFVVSSELVTEDELHFFVAKKLPSYMVPDLICLLDDLPRTPNGKVDVTRLSVVMPLPTQHIEPQTETEMMIAGIWQDLLQLDKIGIHQNFFSLGGHSLLGMQLIAQLRNVYGINIPLNLIFIAPTIHKMGTEIEHLLMETTDEDELLKLFELVESL